jgi:hypothetical protein
MGSAVYDWASEIVTPFRLKHRDILQNSGPEQIISLVEEYVKAAQADHQDFIVAELHKLAADWTTGELLSMDMLFGNIASDTAANIDGKIGGIVFNRRATVDRARAAGVATVGVANANTHFAVGDVVTVQDMPAAYNTEAAVLTAVTATSISYAISVTTTETTASETGGKVSKRGYWQATRVTSSAGSEDIAAAFRRVTNLVFKASRKRPTHIIAGFDVYEEFEDYLALKGQIPTGGDSVNTRWSVLKFGDLEIRLDPDCQDDRAYFINQPSLRFAYCAGEFMKSYPAQPLEGTLDTVVPIASTLVFGLAERRANGLLIRTA